METVREIDPIRRSVTVRRSVEDAFTLFTEGMGSWWPLETHSIAVDEERGRGATTVVFEPKEGGRVYEVMEDSTEGDWARVLHWEPPHRLVLAWKPNTRPVPPTELEIRFTSVDEGTRVELEHRGWERLGARGEESRAEYASGWLGALERFVSAAEG